jgi:hypothetical protein
MPSLSNRRIEAAASEPEALVRLLIEAGERVPPRLRERILGLGEAAVPPLLAIAADEALDDEEAPGKGWAPVHAVELLGELRVPAAAEPLLRLLQETEPGAYLYDELLQALPELGPAVVEPALAAYQTVDPERRFSLGSVLAGLGVRDDRIYAALVEEFQQEPVPGTMHLAEYGDPRALPLLSKALDDYQEINTDDPMANHLVVELEDAIQHLGGELTPEQQEKVRRIVEHDRPKREQFLDLIDRAVGRMDLATSPVRGARALTAEPRPARPARKVGRNDPCPCGSGKKYKKCCLGKDED